MVIKNPNGYGSVVKLGGKRRRPFAARVTIGWDKSGKQLYDYLDYFETRPAAMIALAEYNKNPYDLTDRKITFSDMYKLFAKEKYYKFENGVKVNKISDSTINGYIMGYNQSEDLHNMVFIEIRKVNMQKVIDECGLSYSAKMKIKGLYKQLYIRAMQNDLLEKNYSDFVEIGKNETPSTRKPFTQVEIDKLWDNVNLIDFVDTVLIMIYTGLRPGEIILIENKNINLEERYMRGGIKTAAGINRIIPINKKIAPLIERRMSENNEFFIINNKGKNMTYKNYYNNRWKGIMKELSMKHKPHDSRHTFATLMDNAGANKVSIQRIMGHAAEDVTDQVYTHKDLEQLIKAIDKI